MPVRATVSDFGPQLLAKVLGANETQESSLALVFHYADSKSLPLLDLTDLRALLSFLASDDGKAELEGIGGVSKATVGVLLRNRHRLRARRPIARAHDCGRHFVALIRTHSRRRGKRRQHSNRNQNNAHQEDITRGICKALRVRPGALEPNT